jgi:hypothetical protein
MVCMPFMEILVSASLGCFILGMIVGHYALPKRSW